jgi:hypothetical protein
MCILEITPAIKINIQESLLTIGLKRYHQKSDVDYYLLTTH